MYVPKPGSQELEWRLQPRWIREMNKPGEFTFGTVNNPFPVFWLVRSGVRTIEIGGERQTIRPGDIVAFPPGLPYKLLPDQPEHPVHYLSVGCSVSIGPFDLHHTYRLPRVKSGSDSASLAQLVDIWSEAARQFQRTTEAIKLHQRSAAYPWPTTLASLRLQGNLHMMFTELLTLLVDGDPTLPISFDPRIVKACVYVRDLGHRPISLEEWAAHVHLSPSHFSHLFRHALGQSPVDYLRRHRIGLAKELLIRTSLSVKDIAEQVGYAEQSQFSRTFRKSESISPLAYRQSWQRSELWS